MLPNWDQFDRSLDQSAMRAASKVYGYFNPPGVRRPWRGVVRRTRAARKAVRIACRPETKYFDVALAATAAAAGGQVVNLNNFGEGTEYNSRIGRVVANAYIQYQLNIYPPSTSGLMDEVQWAIVFDKQGDSNQPTYAQIFDQNVHHIAMEFRNISQFAQRFKILKMGRVKVANGTPDLQLVQHGFIKMPPSCIRSLYGGSGSVIPETGGLFFVFASYNNTATSAGSASVAGSFRVAYHDC